LQHVHNKVADNVPVLQHVHNKVDDQVDLVAHQDHHINLVDQVDQVDKVDQLDQVVHQAAVVQVFKVVPDKVADQVLVVAEILRVHLVKVAQRRAVNKRVRKLCVMISRTCKRQLLAA
jgi:hypothetical protein